MTSSDGSRIFYHNKNLCCIINVMKNFLISLLDWIYKKKCYFCGNSKNSIKMCPSCYDELEYLSLDVDRVILGINIYCAGVYDKNLQKLIRGLKYHNQRDLAYFQAKFMYGFWIEIPESKNNFIIVPIPLFKKREKERKYNHMALVAEEFSKLTGFMVNYELVKRIKDTKPQYNLSKNQRMENLAEAFLVNKKENIHGKILLIDDICTTGATFENIIMELKKQGISDITCLATTTPIM